MRLNYMDAAGLASVRRAALAQSHATWHTRTTHVPPLTCGVPLYFPTLIRRCRAWYTLASTGAEKSPGKTRGSMDIFVLKALVNELRQRLCGAVVSKVFQMSPEDVLLRLWRHQDLRL